MSPALEEQPLANGTNHQPAKRIHIPLTPPKHPTRSLQFLDELNGEPASLKVSLEAKVKLNIIVVGAGLGGLACAIALARQGHKVVVYEQTVVLAEVCPPYLTYLVMS